MMGGREPFNPLVPAKAGTQNWIPAFAGMSGISNIVLGV